MSFIVGALSLSGGTERLAGVAASEDVDGRDGGPVDLGDIVEVRHAGPVVLEDRGRGRLVLAVPGDDTVERLERG
ncbi:hypothetical protein A5N75_08255 [Prescottella equi]|nr:hypothetical protein A5N75_08255 [Prescottella equi]